MNLLSNLVLPSTIVYGLVVLGLLAAVYRRTRVLSWWLLAASGITNVALSSGMAAAALMSPLEYSNEAPEGGEAYPSVDHIVVLTAWASDDQNMPLSARLNASSLYRVIYALELYRTRPDRQLVISGSEVSARLMAEVLVELGVPRDRVSIDGDSLSTAQSASALRGMLGDEPFLLVTSAGHIPRALGLFRHQGLRPIPAPTDFQLPKDWWYAEAQPSPYSLTVTDLAMHEYAGLLWYRLRGLL